MRSFFKPLFYIRLKTLKRLLFFLPLLFFSGVMFQGTFFTSARNNELIILWEDSISPEESASRLSVLCPELTLTEHFDNVSVCRSAFPERMASQLGVLNADPAVRVAEQNYPIVPCALEIPAYFDTQWALHNDGDYVYYINDLPIARTSLADVDINLPEAYEQLEKLSSDRTVIVAVIDTGVDITHPALSGHLWVNEGEIPFNGIDDDNNGYVDDVYGWDFYHNDNTVCHYSVSDLGTISADPEDNDNHGTHCAGIIAASGDILGVAAGIDIRILPLKVHGGAKTSGSVANAIKAVKYAEAAGADICNMSWGTSVYSKALETIMRESDMLFVVAAGNNGSNNNAAPLYPSSYDLENMISVAFVTQYGELASDSNYGVSTVDLAAPGQDIYSTVVGGGYHYLSGSSMAAPVVSGAAALLYACGDSLYPQNIREILIQTLKPLDSLNGFVRYPGIPDVAKALAAADLLVSDQIAPTLRPVTTYFEDTISVELNPEDLGGSGIRIISYAMGTRTASYFCHGTVGQTMTEPVLHLKKAGTYTLYISDYAGNETCLVYTVNDDITPPSLSVSYVLNEDGTFTVTVHPEDSESGIKRVRYLEGTHSTDKVLSSGKELTSDTSYTFIAKQEGSYTICAADYRGNKTASSFDIKKIPARQLFLSAVERTLLVGESYSPVVLMLPLNATDRLMFAVDDETLLHADVDGTLTALAPGTAEVTVTSTSGVSKTCVFHILPNPSAEEEPTPTPPELTKDPESPEVSITPEVPDVPAVPEVSDTPDISKTPELPDVSDIPDISKAPEASGAPKPPGVPEGNEAAHKQKDPYTIRKLP